MMTSSALSSHLSKLSSLDLSDLTAADRAAIVSHQNAIQAILSKSRSKTNKKRKAASAASAPPSKKRTAAQTTRRRIANKPPAVQPSRRARRNKRRRTNAKNRWRATRNAELAIPRTKSDWIEVSKGDHFVALPDLCLFCLRIKVKPAIAQTVTQEMLNGTRLDKNYRLVRDFFYDVFDRTVAATNRYFEENNARALMPKHDQIQIFMCNDPLDREKKRYFQSPFIKIGQFKSTIMSILRSRLDYWKTFVIDENTICHANIAINKLAGRAKTSAHVGKSIEAYAKSRHFVPILNTHDHLCAARAIVTCLAYICCSGEYHASAGRMRNDPTFGKITERMWASIRLDKSGEQENHARRLHLNAGVEEEGGCAENELEAFAKTGSFNVSDFCIKVFHFGVEGANRLVKTINAGDGKPIVCLLMMPSGHYHAVLNANVLFAYKWCHRCDQEMKRSRKPCLCAEVACKHCGSPECDESTKRRAARQIECKDCGCFFNTERCKSFHKCGTRFFCKLCKQGFPSTARHNKANHVCHQVECKSCKKMCDPGHACWIKQTKLRLQDESSRPMLFFRVATSKDAHGEMTVEAVVCQTEDGEEHAFDSVDEFCLWLCESKERHLVLGLNSRAFDHHFVAKWAVEQSIKFSTFYKPKTRKLMSASLVKYKIEFRDVANVFADMSMQELSEAFDGGGQSSFFAHGLPKDAWASTTELPDDMYFGVATMKKDQYRRYLQWREQQCGATSLEARVASVEGAFLKLKDVWARRAELGYAGRKAELKTVCLRGVAVTKGKRKEGNALGWRGLGFGSTGYDHRRAMRRHLSHECGQLRRACLAYQEAMARMVGKPIAVFEYLSTGQMSKSIYTSEHLLPDTIANLKKDRRDTCSKPSVQWLEYLSIKHGCKFVHACNNRGREEQVAGMKIDGVCVEQKRWAEFNGCYHHGCPRCFPTDRDVKRTNLGKKNTPKSYNQVYKEQLHKEAKLRATLPGWTGHVIWNCEWRDMASDVDVKAKAMDRVTDEFFAPIRNRDALYGGSVQTNYALYDFEAKSKHEGSRIVGRKVDINKSYGFDMIRRMFPAGQPVVRKGIDAPTVDDVVRHPEKYFGVFKVDIVPNPDAPHVVLPRHDNDGSMVWSLDPIKGGVYCSPELHRAVARGYTLQRIHEFVEFEPKPLFEEIGRKYMTFTVESKGVPNGWSVDAYVAELRARGYDMAAEQVAHKDSALSKASKMVVNTLVSKFAQAGSDTKTQIVHKSQGDVTQRVLFGKEYERTAQIMVLNKENQTILLTSSKKEEYADSVEGTNPFVYSFLTCYGRLSLLDFKERLHPMQCIYENTDSLIYAEDMGGKMEGWGRIEPSVFPGGMKDELGGADTWIVEFASTGRGVQSFVDNHGREESKIIGMRMGQEVSKTVNHERMKEVCAGMVGSIDGIPQTRNVGGGWGVKEEQKQHRLQLHGEVLDLGDGTVRLVRTAR